MKKKLALLLLAALSSSAQETWQLYYAEESGSGEKMAEHVAPLLPKGVELQLLPMPATCKDAQAARRHEQAIAAGISTLPSLVLRDAQGAYAALPLQGLSEGSIAQAQKQAHDPRRAEAQQQRSRTARLYCLRALWMLTDSPQDQDKIIRAYRDEMLRPGTSEETKQFIGLYCLYPALMQQYAAEYNGAHSPRTEAKLLEAIAALEEVRDMNADSPLGRRAHEAREILRAARLKSRQYE